MTTIMIQVTDEQAQLLTEEAARLSVPVQELAARRLFTPWQSVEEVSADTSFQEAADYVFQKNSELYRRLA